MDLRSPGASRYPLLRSFITFLQVRRALPGRRTHGSPALVKEVNNAGFENPVANGQHMVAVRNIECARPRNKRGQFLGAARDLILCPDGNQTRRPVSSRLYSTERLPRATNAGGQRTQIRIGLIGKYP